MSSGRTEEAGWVKRTDQDKSLQARDWKISETYSQNKQTIILIRIKSKDVIITNIVFIINHQKVFM